MSNISWNKKCDPWESAENLGLRSNHQPLSRWHKETNVFPTRTIKKYNAFPSLEIMVENGFPWFPYNNQSTKGILHGL